MKVYLVFKTERHFNPDGEVTFDGITRIVGIFDDPDKAEEMAQKSYEECKHFQWENYVCMGDYDDLDELFTFFPDQKLIINLMDNEEWQWKVKEVELNEELN